MSIFPTPETISAEVKNWEEQFKAMNRDIAHFLPKDLAGTANLMAHPVAAVAAGSAIGFGLASQAFGMWMGVMAGAMETSQRMMTPLSGEPEPFSPAPKSPAAQATAAARTMLADAARTADHAADTASKAADAAVENLKVVSEAAVAVAAPAVEAATEALAKPAAVAKPRKPDDLKAISGVGPKLEKVLNDLGVWTYAQIAAWEEEQVAWVDDYLAFSGRISRDRWIEQAGALAKPGKK